MSDEPTIIKLEHPIEFGKDNFIEELSLRPGRLGDMKGVKIRQVPDFDDLTKIASRMSGQQIAVIEKLEGDDVFKITGPALLFFGKCLGIGDLE